mmetsp:Transcript_21203/g.44212  ORF Transcript_21203/g.44212 Transcript_21203/m.44212 type:complete len:220 (-) Transcript_21203:202-861(-)
MTVMASDSAEPPADTASFSRQSVSRRATSSACAVRRVLIVERWDLRFSFCWPLAFLASSASSSSSSPKRSSSSSSSTNKSTATPLLEDFEIFSLPQFSSSESSESSNILRFLLALLLPYITFSSSSSFFSSPNSFSADEKYLDLVLFLFSLTGEGHIMGSDDKSFLFSFRSIPPSTISLISSSLSNNEMGDGSIFFFRRPPPRGGGTGLSSISSSSIEF